MRVAATIAILAAFCPASPAAESIGDPVLDRPTLHSLGVHWIIRGQATVKLEYRKQGDSNWRRAPNLFRVAPKTHLAAKHGSLLNVPDDATLHAGSAVLLDPDTPYELRLTLGDTQKILSARTRAEPRAPSDARVLHVTPGEAGGSGTTSDPFRGLAAAQSAAQPGDILLLKGTFPTTLQIIRNGEPSRPIIWRGDGTAVIDAQGTADKRPPAAILATTAHDVWFENLTLRNADYGISANDSTRLVIRRCRIEQVDYGITATRNTKADCEDFFITDNVISGPSTWPRTKGIEPARGVQVTGSGHVIAYNRIRGFADAINTYGSARCDSIDIHNNDVSELTDDGIELDYSTRNVRCFHNRITNAYHGISAQPVHGGPAYIFRNTMHNIAATPFKLHNRTSGVLMLHSTVLKTGRPVAISTPEEIRNCLSRNNLFVGTAAPYAFESSAPMTNCDFDHDAFAGGPFASALKWNGKRYRTPEDVRANAPVYKHMLLIDAAKTFASGATPPDSFDKQAQPADLRLSPNSAAIDAAQPLPGFNDTFSGKAPDLGAFELDALIPHYGPRPDPR